jgi:hypothetical protein
MSTQNNTPPLGGRGAGAAAFITPATFQQYEDISVNIKPERLAVFIKKAQELDLKPFLTPAFYYELMRYITADGELSEDAPEHIQNLVNGCDYTDPQGHIITYEGLVPMLVYFTFARFIEGNSVFYTATGPVVKQYDNAQAVNPAEVSKLVQQQRSVANAHANNVEKFLQDNHDEQNRPAAWSADKERRQNRTKLPVRWRLRS